MKPADISGIKRVNLKDKINGLTTNIITKTSETCIEE
jgi:hypothetical protein